MTRPAPAGALLWRTSGMKGRAHVVEVGAPPFRVKTPGRLELGINDNQPRDNSGRITVEIDIRPARGGTGQSE